MEIGLFLYKLVTVLFSMKIFIYMITNKNKTFLQEMDEA